MAAPGMSVGGAYAALTFRPWDFDVTTVRCPAHLCTAAPTNGRDRGGDWLAARIPGAPLHVVPPATHLATLLGSWEAILTSLLD